MKKKYVYIVWQRLIDDNDFDNYTDDIEACFSNLTAAKKYAENFADEDFDSWARSGNIYHLHYDEFTTSRFYIEKRELRSKM